MSDKLLVTGASGQLGRLVLHHLLETQKVRPQRIVAASRDTSKLAEFTAKGVEVRKADFDDETSLPAAFEGIDRVLIISTDAVGEPGKRLRQHLAAVEAAKKAGVAHILYTSMPKPDAGSPVTFAGDHRETEESVKATGIPYTIIRNSWYQENLLGSLPQVVSSGKWYSSAGDGRVSHVARDDTAAAIAAALASSTNESAIYTLTGPTSFTTAEIAAQVSEATGKPIEVVKVSDEALAEGIKAATGLPAPVVNLIVSFDTNTRLGRVDFVTDDVRKLTGREPASLRAFLNANKASLGA
ncbi:SDR family oxidoreductase [Aquamicrobium sp. LC103]|uniref:SDR family oxidoreductase n=1 Tax=Aquamicrobium sp. LC103 TaxID=1120658 RepID=UPI00063EB945|nr:SDR family oxidoreductase [Aquamicrobium sp. LC103]TKT80088.1 SDR family oxidoreductase [Aquamicrobium sp. LC103]